MATYLNDVDWVRGQRRRLYSRRRRETDAGAADYPPNLTPLAEAQARLAKMDTTRNSSTSAGVS